MSAERRVRSQSSNEYPRPKEFAPRGANTLLKPLAGSTFGEFHPTNASQNFIMIEEEKGQECEGGTCVEVTADLTTDNGLLMMHAHISGNDRIQGGYAWNRLNTPAPDGHQVDLVKLEPALQTLFDRLAEHGIALKGNPTSTPK